MASFIYDYSVQMFSALEAQGKHGSSKLLCSGNPCTFDNVAPEGPCSEEKGKLVATYVNSAPPSLEVSQVRVKSGLGPGDENPGTYICRALFARAESANPLFFESLRREYTNFR